MCHYYQDADGVRYPEDLLPADRIFDAVALRLSAYALHESSYRLVPTGTRKRSLIKKTFSENPSIDRPIGSEPG
jgi:hypothetical protein